MLPRAGRTLPLSLPRRVIDDLMHASRHVPLVPMERCMDVAAVAAARRAATPRPSWCALFTKAFGFVAAARPQLRRAYLAFPWSRLYEHPVNVASVAVEACYGGEEAVFFAQVQSPERQSLTDLDAYLRRCKEQPVERMGLSRRALRISRLPRPVRHLLWWLALQTSGPLRVRHCGTFGVSVTAGQGASTLALRSPLTATLHYGVLGAGGALEVRLTFDHRVLDGANVARALGDLERVLHSEILTELRSLPAVRIA
jgi:hypothetical protein